MQELEEATSEEILQWLARNVGPAFADQVKRGGRLINHLEVVGKRGGRKVYKLPSQGLMPGLRRVSGGFAAKRDALCDGQWHVLTGPTQSSQQEASGDYAKMLQWAQLGNAELLAQVRAWPGARVAPRGPKNSRKRKAAEQDRHAT